MALPVHAVRLELKAGTSSPDGADVVFDDLKIAVVGTDKTVLLWEDFGGASLDSSTWGSRRRAGIKRRVSRQSGEQPPVDRAAVVRG